MCTPIRFPVICKDESMETFAGETSLPDRLTVQFAQNLTYQAHAPERLTEEALHTDVCRQVTDAATLGKSRVVCRIPDMVLDLPRFDRRLLRDKVAYKFQKEGFTVMTKDVDLLLISWAAPEKDDKKKPDSRKKPKQSVGFSLDTQRAMSRFAR